MTLPEKAYDFAYDADTDALAASTPEFDKLFMFPKILDQTGQAKTESVVVGKSPTRILCRSFGKGAVFVVLCSEESKLVLVDTKSPTVIKTIALPGAMQRELIASPDPKDPFVYFIQGTGHDCRLTRVHLETGATASLDHNIAFASIGSNGKYVYFGGPWSPSGFQVHEMLDASPDAKRVPTRTVHHKHESHGFYFPDPLGRLVVVGSSVWSPDLKTRIRDLGFTPFLISRHRPLMFGFQNGLAAASTNSFSVVGRLSGLDLIPSRKDFRPFDKDARSVRVGNQILTSIVRVFENARGTTLLACKEDQVHVVPIAALQIAEEPLLACDVDGPREATIGTPMSLSVTVRDSQVKVELNQAPTGVTLQRGKLQWTPTAAHVGEHSIKLKLTAGDFQTEHAVQVTVRSPGLELPFDATAMGLHEPTAFAVFLRGSSNRFGPGGFDKEMKVPAGVNLPASDSQLVLVDLKQMKIVADKKWSTPLTQVAVDAHHVYVGLADSDAFFVLDRKDLSQVKRLFTNGRVTGFVPVADRLLFVRVDRDPPIVLKVPSMELADPSEVGLGHHLTAKGRAGVVPARVGQAWYCDGILYNANFNKALLAVQPRVSSPPNIDPRFGGGPPLAVPAWLYPWGTTLQYRTLTHGNRSIGAVGKARDERFGPAQARVAALVLADRPMAAALSVATERRNNAFQKKVTLTYHDLTSAAPIEEVTLFDEPGDGAGDPRFGGPFGQALLAQTLHSVDGKLLALADRRLWLVALPKVDSAKTPAPLHFEMNQSVIALSKGENVVALPKLVGAKDAVEWQFRRETPGVDLDSGKRTIRIDRETLVNHVLQQIASPTASAAPYFGENGPGFQAKQSAQKMARLFEAMSSKKPAGVPLWVTIGLVATDKNLQSAEITLGFFVEAPEEHVLAKLGQRDPGGAVARPAVKLDGPPDQVLRHFADRITDLENQLDRLQRTVDQLNRRLGGPPFEGGKK